MVVNAIFTLSASCACTLCCQDSIVCACAGFAGWCAHQWWAVCPASSSASTPGPRRSLKIAPSLSVRAAFARHLALTGIPFETLETGRSCGVSNCFCGAGLESLGDVVPVTALRSLQMHACFIIMAVLMQRPAFHVAVASHACACTGESMSLSIATLSAILLQDGMCRV